MGTGAFGARPRRHCRRDRLRAARASRRCRSRSSASTSGGPRSGIRSPGEFGALPFIWGTLYSSILALLHRRRRSRSASPSSSPSSARRRLRQPLVFLTELLAAIPVDRLRPLGHLRAGAGGARVRDVDAAGLAARLPLFSGPPLGVGMLSAALILAVMVIPFTSSVAREVLKSVPAGAARRRLRARRDALRGDPRGALLRAHRHRRRDHARLRPRARRDDGGDDGDWQQPEDVRVAVRAAVHDGGGHRERVHRGRRPISTSAALVEIGLVLFIITLDRQLALAAADLEHGAERDGRRRTGREPAAEAAA